MCGTCVEEAMTSPPEDFSELSERSLDEGASTKGVMGSNNDE